MAIRTNTRHGRGHECRGYHQQWWVALSGEVAAAAISVIVNICAQLAMDGGVALIMSLKTITC